LFCYDGLTLALDAFLIGIGWIYSYLGFSILWWFIELEDFWSWDEVLSS